MKFNESGLPGAFTIDVEPIHDRRGFFARGWCKKEAAEHGIHLDFVQCSISYNLEKGVLRGMHFQYPNWETKLVRVTRGSILDVIVDIRPTSATYRQHYAVELSGENRRMLLVPEGCAHGFLTLEDDTELFYQMSEYWVSDQGRGFRWDDPQFAITWPEGDKILSDRDLGLPFYEAIRP